MDYLLQTFLKGYKRIPILLICIVTYTSQGQSKQQIEKITNQYNFAAIDQLSRQFQKEYQAKSSRLSLYKASNMWLASKKIANGNSLELQDIGPDGTPLYYTIFNDNVSHASRANALYTNGSLNLGVNGQGMRVGVWDAGIALTNHQEFDNRVTVWDQTEKVGSHATMVMGTLLASGVKRRATGVAYEATAISSDWSKDRKEVLDAAADGLLLSNHSYGINPANVPDWYFGAYLHVSQDWDKIMFAAPYYLMVTAAGNAQQLHYNEASIDENGTTGFDLLLGFATSKNGITVAAADTHIDNQGNLLDASISNYSSFGPVDDGRIKPDIASVGSAIYSSDSKGKKSYRVTSGTSMATPGVTSSMLLLQQYYEQLYGNYMRAATLKGLVLHSADDVNLPGPDYQMGWGIMNTKRAAEIITAKEYSSLILEEELVPGESYTITVNASENEALVASISWTDPAGNYTNSGDLNNTTPALINDLDIRITQEGTSHYPWKLNPTKAMDRASRGDNLVDPFEKVEIENPKGAYTITISHKGDLVYPKQQFSLVVSGVQLTACNTLVPSGVYLSEEEKGKVKLHWDAIPEANYLLEYREVDAEQWNAVQTLRNFYSLENLEEGMTYELRIQTACNARIKSEFSQIMGFTYVENATILKDRNALDNIVNSNELAFSMYPNPTTDQLYLEGNFSEQTEYQIINTTGIVIKQGKASEAAIRVSNLASGMYFITLVDTQGTRTGKFYKN